MDYSEIKEKMEKTIESLVQRLSEVRAGRANPAILNKVKIDYYGTPTPINQVAGISVPEARMIMIQPWDVSILKEIEKAILASEIGINPNNDGKVIRLVFPELTEERRKDLVKEIKKYAEDAKVSIRNARRDGIDKAKAMQKDGDITEDELKAAETEIQKITDKYIEEVDKTIIAKETGFKTRAIEFSTLQRAASHIASLTDINEAEMVGQKAVEEANNGNTGMMVTLVRKSSNPYSCETGIYDIHDIANVEKKVPIEWIDLDNNQMKQEFIDYAKPLIIGELQPIYKDGIPQHLLRK